MRARVGNMRERERRADFDIINYKYTIGGRRVCGIRKIIGESYKCGTFELDLGGCKLWNV